MVHKNPEKWFADGYLPAGMPKKVRSRLALGTMMLAAWTVVQAQGEFRPPAVPLVACDPYFSIWSRATRLADADTTHWTGKPQRLMSEIAVDGKSYRLMGAGAGPALPRRAFRSPRPARSIDLPEPAWA